MAPLTLCQTSTLVAALESRIRRASRLVELVGNGCMSCTCCRVISEYALLMLRGKLQIYNLDIQ